MPLIEPSQPTYSRSRTPTRQVLETYQPISKPEKKLEINPKVKLEHQLQDLEESIRSLKLSRCDYVPLPKTVRVTVPIKARKGEDHEAPEDPVIYEIKAKVEELTKKVGRLQAKLDSTTEEEAVNLSAATLPRTSYREATFRPQSAETSFTAAFETHIKEWQNRVLSPALERIRFDVESSRTSSPEHPKVRSMLNQLHHKQAQRTAKLYQLNKEKQRRLREPPYLREYDEFVSLDGSGR